MSLLPMGRSSPPRAAPLPDFFLAAHGGAWGVPGLTRLLVDGVSLRDIPLIQACAMIFGSVYILLNLLADILSILANPRLRYPK